MIDARTMRDHRERAEVDVSDPRAMRPSDLVRLLNSTPLGEVIDARTMRDHRERGGMAVGDAKTVNLVRYLAWLVNRSAQAKRAADPLERDEAYARQRERAARRARIEAETARDIGECPAVKRPDVKEACRLDLRCFALTYFPNVFTKPFSDDHDKAIATLQRCALQGGQFAWSMPRGSGKTALCIVAALWMVLYGHRRFVVLIGAAATPHAVRLADAIGKHITQNERLAEDFPEVCFPIRSLQGIAGRAPGQLCRGIHASGGEPKPTNIRWSGAEIVFPTVAGSAASSAAIYTAGLTGSIRGQQFVRPDGSVARPDLVIVDDPQTDESAMSLAQCAARLRIIRGAVLGLAGPGETIAAVMPCTVIRAGDVADELLDRKRHPMWNGQRTKMVYAFPVNEKLWDKYAVLWAESQSVYGGGDIRLATEFYAKHREAMDAGASVSWVHRYRGNELSAIQHAMNLKIQDEASFWSEYQSEPQEERGALDVGILTPEQIADRLNRVKRGVVPLGAAMLTAFIDVQQDLLFWVVAAWQQDFTGSVIDYDAFPEQHSDHFTLRNSKRKLSTLHPGAGVEGSIHQGLEELITSLLAREWLREDGAPMRISLCFVDANWDVSTPIVYEVCRRHDHAAQLLPSHGHFVGPGRVAMTERKKQLGDRVGTEWRIPGHKGTRRGRHIVFDANYWKTFIHSRLGVAIGDPGALTLFGTRGQRHRMIAEHLTAETRERVQGPRRIVDVWTLKPGRDNHWLDGLVGCAVAASVLGAALPNMQSARRPKKKRRVSLSELQRQRRASVL